MTTQNSSGKVKSPSRLAHVVLRTSAGNFQTMAEYYKKFLGAHAVYENQFLSFLTYDDEHHRIAIAALPGIEGKNPTSTGLEVCKTCSVWSETATNVIVAHFIHH
jgi:catechol-2,3-dioxygenase